MTTLDDIYTFVPGGQASWHPNTSPSDCLLVDLAAWRAIQAAPSYNAPLSWPVNRNFAPLLDLVAEARRSAGPWTPDMAADSAEQQENAWVFRESQLNVILGQDD